MTAEPAPGGVSIGCATPADVPGVAALIARLFQIEADFASDPAVQARGLELLLEQPAHRARVAVARAGGAIVGTASGQLVVSTGEGALSVWIEDVFVDPQWRGRHVGRHLLADLLDWARTNGATRAQLLIDLDNMPAEGFYARLGWQGTRLGVRRLMLAPA
jgi:GNAT superfamily N-acetyltransferase